MARSYYNSQPNCGPILGPLLRATQCDLAKNSRVAFFMRGGRGVDSDTPESTRTEHKAQALAGSIGRWVEPEQVQFLPSALKGERYEPVAVVSDGEGCLVHASH